MISVLSRAATTAVLLTILGGCTSTSKPRWSWFSRKKPEPAEQQVAEADTPDEQKDGADESEEDEPKPSGRRRLDPESDGEAVAENADNPDEKTENSEKKISGDLLTQIDEALPDAPEEQRQAVYKQLKQVNPELWPNILASHAMIADLVKRRSESPQAEAAQATQRASHEQTSPEGHFSSVDRYGPSPFPPPTDTRRPAVDAYAQQRPEISPGQSGRVPPQDWNRQQYARFDQRAPQDPRQSPGAAPPQYPPANANAATPQPSPDAWRHMQQQAPSHTLTGVTASRPQDTSAAIAQVGGTGASQPNRQGRGVRQADDNVDPRNRATSNRGVVIPAQYPGAPTNDSGSGNGPSPSGTATAGRTSVPDQEWTQALHKLIRMAEEDVNQADPDDIESYTAKHVYLRMLYLMADRPEQAVVAIPAPLEPQEQEFWQTVFWAVTNYFDTRGMPDPSDRATQTIEQLRTAIARLQPKAKLGLRNLTFCTSIDGYGNYTAVERDTKFSRGDVVMLYVEVENFASRYESGFYRTELASTIEVYAPNGTLLDTQTFPGPSVDLCRNHRRDYYLNYTFALPRNLGPGPHFLKLIVEDQTSRKIATETLNFTVQ